MNRQIFQLIKRSNFQKHCLHDSVNITKVGVAFVSSNPQLRYLSSAPKLPNLTPPPDNMTWFLKKAINTRVRLGMTPRSNTYYRLRGLILFRNIEQVNWREFFTTFNMPDTFHSWFLVIELHMWMLNVRGSDEGKEGNLLKRYSVECMWEGAQKRAKKLESYSSLQEGFEILHEEFLGAFVLYDYGLLTSDVALADALWYRFLQEKCNEPQKLELLVKHVRKQIHLLDQLSREDFVERANITWLPLSDKS